METWCIHKTTGFIHKTLDKTYPHCFESHDVHPWANRNLTHTNESIILKNSFTQKTVTDKKLWASQETAQLPFWVEFPIELSFVLDKLIALTILNRGRSNGNPSLRWRDLRTSTAHAKFFISYATVIRKEEPQNLVFTYKI